jgi:hypothetical protein
MTPKQHQDMLTVADTSILQLTRDLARMTRRHRDALRTVRKLRAEIGNWDRTFADMNREMEACRNDRNETLQLYLVTPRCARRCPFRRAHA